MSVGELNRHTSWSQDSLVTTIDPRFSYFLPRFFPTVKQFDGEFIEWDIKEGGHRIAPYASPLSLGKSTRETGYRTYQIKPAYIKLLDTVRPQQGFTRRAGETYGGSLSPNQRLEILTAEKIVTHRDMIEYRLEAMASEALFTGKLTIFDDDYPRAVVDFERDPNLDVTVGVLWSNAAADPMTDIVSIADALNSSSRGAVADTLTMRTAVWDFLTKNTKVRELVERDKNLSPGTSALELGGRSSDRGPVYRGRLAGQYDIWTYDGYYANDVGQTVAFTPSNKVLVTSNQAIEGMRYHGAIFDMDAQMQAMEVFTKNRTLWNPSGREVLTQSAPMLGMRRPNATAVLTVL